MTPTLDFSAQVTDGRIPRTTAEKLAACFSGFEGKRILITVKEQKRRRSLSANAYYWAAVLPPIVQAFRDHGNNVDAEDVHAYLKEHVGKLKQVFVTPAGEVLTGPGSTAKLGTQEFQLYIEQVRAWAAQMLGVGVPLAGEAA